jgi:endogenous inhibitor of DNA gyrase (YacG/DUF329 family)
MAHRRNLDPHNIPEGLRVIALTCKHCGGEFLRDASFKWVRPKFCSAKCDRDSRAASYKTIEKKCSTCGTNYFCTPHKSEISKYCSLKCKWRAMARHGVIERPCGACGKPVVRRANRFDSNVYCGYECMGKARRLAIPKSRQWPAVRKWFSHHGRMSECEACGYDEIPGILVIHHKDRDRNNNELSNLAVLCPNCHALEHLKERANNWSGHRSTDPSKIALRSQRLEEKSRRRI